MRLAVLHTELASYFIACLQRFHTRHAAELLVHAWPPHPDAPFDFHNLRPLGEVFDRRESADEVLIERVRAFSPDAVLTCGWVDKGYMRACRKLRSAGIPVIAGCDTQYTGNWRQWLGKLSAPVHLHRAIDVIWAAGERQKQLASFLAYPADRIWEGYYSCDVERFSAEENTRAGRRAFVFVGRCVESKGALVLAEAYRRYAGQVKEPWPLRVAGTGPLQVALQEAGALCAGFVQPEKLPGLMNQTGVLVLPSLFEPWGVVVHEAASAGLSLLCSRACGAADRFLEEGKNGFLTETGSVEALAGALSAFHHLDDVMLERFSFHSRELARWINPDSWADTLYEGVMKLRGRG
ncbi:glycosyltransferase family 4 protein [Termitidicoccus mucosus]|uniref:Glycosyl transferase family 1 domain-containing protein n=1 Tax=Termitidicoccus mucosus TaxID=1184151 RepID=A0A178IFF7_9BACT|nr:hypothetical protein AW736_20270 [Opitutaceae bacterium TSB47]